MFGCFIVLEAMLWGMGNVVTKIGLQSIGPFYCLGLRFALAFVISFGLFHKQLGTQINQKNLKDAVFISLLNVSAFIFSTVALIYTSATVAGFLMGLAVIFTPFMSCFILKRKFRKRTLGFVALVVAGMYLLCGSQAGFRFGVGEVLALLSSVAFAANLIYSSKHVVGIGPQALATVQTGIAALVCLILALIFEDYHTLAQTTTTSWLCVIYLAVGCTVVAYLLQNTALGHLSAIFVSLALSSEPIFTAVFSAVILGESLTITGAAGAGLIMTSIVLASVFNRE